MLCKLRKKISGKALTQWHHPKGLNCLWLENSQGFSVWDPKKKNRLVLRGFRLFRLISAQSWPKWAAKWKTHVTKSRVVKKREWKEFIYLFFAFSPSKPLWCFRLMNATTVSLANTDNLLCRVFPCCIWRPFKRQQWQLLPHPWGC